jgi:hypothetical protein
MNLTTEQTYKLIKFYHSMIRVEMPITKWEDINKQRELLKETQMQYLDCVSNGIPEYMLDYVEEYI